MLTGAAPHLFSSHCSSELQNSSHRSIVMLLKTIQQYKINNWLSEHQVISGRLARNKGYAIAWVVSH
jgi:hypothetical protein